MVKLIIFSPLIIFVVYAAFHLTADGPRPFLLKWIDLSMAFMIALFFALALKKILLKENNHNDEDGNS